MCRGVVTYQEFINALNLPDCALIQQVFSYFDLRDQGFINFSQVCFYVPHYWCFLRYMMKLQHWCLLFQCSFLVEKSDLMLSR
jgi:hypothetical protein